MSKATKTRQAVFGVLPIIALVLGYQEVSMSQARANGGIKNVVLVHGGFVDGSGWQGVYDTLKKDGYNVSIVQNPTISLADDVAVTKRTLAAQDGPAILVGHSYGGVVITEAGQRSEGRGPRLHRGLCSGPGRVGRVLDQESAAGRARAADPAASGRLPVSRPGEVPSVVRRGRQPDEAAFMADSQVPWGLEALNGAVTRAGVEDEAKLVPRRDRRQDDSAGCAAHHVEARGLDRRRSEGESRRLRVATAGGCGLIAKAANGVALATR